MIEIVLAVLLIVVLVVAMRTDLPEEEENDLPEEELDELEEDEGLLAKGNTALCWQFSPGYPAIKRWKC